MRTLFYSILTLLLVVVVAACDDYDKWTVSPSAKLEFSVDTVAFDTIITRMSSPTKSLVVFNKHDEGLRISRIETQQRNDSRFRVNVDGQYLYGGVGEDFEVRRQDSIFVKVEVTLPEMDQDAPQHYEDQLVFTLESGVQQKVLLMADGQDVYVLRGETFQRDTTLEAGRPYLIYDSLVVGKDATLTLDPGVCLLFHDSVSLAVHGQLVAEGTLEQPILFRGDRLDRMFTNFLYDNTTNRWGGIHFYGESHDNVMTQCDVHSGDYGIRCDSALVLDIEHPTLMLQDCVVHNVGGDGLAAQDCYVQAIGTQFSNTLGATVSLVGGAYTFLHCTIAQFYPWSADRSYALYLANNVGSEEADYRHLYWAYFLNCVITGYAEDVIQGNIAENQDYKCDYLFQNSFLRTVESKDSVRFVNVIYDLKDEKNDPERLVGSENFVLFETKNIQYDFTPDSLSRIRGMADPELTRQYCPLDRRGRDRMVEGKPDAGAYQFVPQENK